MSNVTMKYGSYSFTPVPFMNITKQKKLSGDGQIIGHKYDIKLEGTLTTLPVPTGGLVDIDALQDALVSGIQQDGKKFEILCDGNSILTTYPKIQSVNFPPNYWVFDSSFSLGMSYDVAETGGPAGTYLLDSLSETWTTQLINNDNLWSFTLPNGSSDANANVLQVSHNISAKGATDYTEGVGTLTKQPWQRAQDYVISQLGVENDKLGSGVINIDPANFSRFNDVKIQNTNEADGTFSVQESWLLFDIDKLGASGVAGLAIESLQVAVNVDGTNGLTFVSLNGTIQGLEKVNFGSNEGDYNVVTSKYSSASGYWANIKPRMYQRAVLFGSGDAYRTIHPMPRRSVTTHSPAAGTIGYQYSYGDFPANCIPGSITESIVIADTNPVDIFSNVFVIGRTNGPVLQDMGTKTAAQRSLSVDAQMQPVTGCLTSASLVNTIMGNSPSGDVNDIVSAVETSLTDTYSQVFRSADQESWSYLSGKYTRNVQWTYGNC